MGWGVVRKREGEGKERGRRGEGEEKERGRGGEREGTWVVSQTIKLIYQYYYRVKKYIEG